MVTASLNVASHEVDARKESVGDVRGDESEEMRRVKKSYQCVRSLIIHSPISLLSRLHGETIKDVFQAQPILGEVLIHGEEVISQLIARVGQATLANHLDEALDLCVAKPAKKINL